MQKILVAGPTARSISALNGCWSYTWQGKEEQWYPKDSKTILQALRDKLGAENVTTTSVPGFSSKENFDASSLTAAAAGVDAIVLCLGENAYAESPGNIADLALPEEQMALGQGGSGHGQTGYTGVDGRKAPFYYRYRSPDERHFDGLLERQEDSRGDQRCING